MGVFTVRTALLGKAAAARRDAPGRAARGDARRRGRTRARGGRSDGARPAERVESLDELDADAIVVAAAAGRVGAAARRARAGARALADRVACTCSSTGRCCARRSPRCSARPAHWVFDRGALTGHPPERGQYLTVVSSGVPDLLEIRGKGLVELMAAELTGRLGRRRAALVARQPRAVRDRRARGPGRAGSAADRATDRPNVVRAGAWTDTGWPATMEGAVRSGVAAARRIGEMRAGARMTVVQELTRSTRRSTRARSACSSSSTRAAAGSASWSRTRR